MRRPRRSGRRSPARPWRWPKPTHRARQHAERLKAGPHWHDQGLVFPDSTGGITRRNNLQRRHYKPVLEKAGLPKETRLYDLRHTFATLWMESGEGAKELQDILGHARISTTLDLYTHMGDRARDDAMGRFGESLGGGF